MKDVIPRYKTMQGYKVLRRWGWDCHGLPIENLIEKELGLITKKDIEAFGIEKFNEAARGTVLRYADTWKRIIPRLGRFVDMENDYRTMDASYTESVWWSWKTLHEKKLVYESFKVMPFCPHCGTTLSNFEVNQGYKDITDISVYVKFALVDEKNTYILAWTTTPWTLPGNVALALKSDIPYVKIEKEGIFYIVAKSLAEKVFEKDFKAVEELKGSDLVGKKYEPVFPYYTKEDALPAVSKDVRQKMWRIYAADFVTTEDGTGVVHIAPAYGDEDYELSKREGLPMIQHVGEDGTFKPEVTDFAGIMVKPKDDHQKTDVQIIKYLAHAKSLFAKEKITHSYPHCWRCETPLLNLATSSWFVRVTDFKDKLVAQNAKVSWIPKEIGIGRFGKWLEGARDWAVSRSRYWGAPLPIWKSEDGSEIEVLGSVEDIRKKTTRNNTFILVRHGESENNVQNILSTKPDNPHHLTEIGRKQVEDLAASLSQKKISAVYASDFIRTKETTDIIAKTLGIQAEKIAFDVRLREVNFGTFEGKNIKDYYKEVLPGFNHAFEGKIGGGENLTDIRRRVGDFIYETDQKHTGECILIVSHETPLWILSAVIEGFNQKQTVVMRKDGKRFIENAEAKEMPFARLPHNANYELDFHRPYIDEIVWKSKTGKNMKRIPEIFDTWYDSGSMPYAQNHYPFENKEAFDASGSSLFPADFIAEGLDQTRGWFYTLLVLSTALFDQSPYKSVVVNGLVLAEDGRKMSKSLKNYPDLEAIIDTYGADALRYFLMSSPAVKAEDVAFSEKGIDEVVKKNIQRLYNVYSFYDMYKNEAPEQNIFDPKKATHPLDAWIICRLSEVRMLVGTHLDAYEFDRASRPLADFIDDLSTWYIRRSRDRFKSKDASDRSQALVATRFVLNEFSKLMAPFMPFTAEDIYQKTKLAGAKESVHL